MRDSSWYIAKELNFPGMPGGDNIAIDLAGNIVIKPGLFDKNYSLGRFREGRAVFCTTSATTRNPAWFVNDDKLIFGCIDRTGKILFSCNDYKTMNRYSEHLALVQTKSTELFGYLDWNGHLKIPALYLALVTSARGSPQFKQEGNSEYGDLLIAKDKWYFHANTRAPEAFTVDWHRC